jgi:hypothetical protein
MLTWSTSCKRRHTTDIPSTRAIVIGAYKQECEAENIRTFENRRVIFVAYRNCFPQRIPPPTVHEKTRRRLEFFTASSPMGALLIKTGGTAALLERRQHRHRTIPGFEVSHSGS